MEGAFASSSCNKKIKIESKLIKTICQNEIDTYRRKCADSQIRPCNDKIEKRIENANDLFKRITRKSVLFYGHYLIQKIYEKDIKTYPALEQFQNTLNQFHREYKTIDRSTGNITRNHASDPTWRGKLLLKARHPHFKNPGFVKQYAKALARAIKKSKCKPDNRCINELAKQLKEDSKTGPQYYCRKVLQEGQACCSAPNKSCGNFTFAKEITSTFAKSVPGLLSSFAQFRGMQGNPQAACKLSALGNVIAPVGQLQIKSCNQALEGCRETCNKRIKGFKAAFRSCFNIKKGDIAKVVRKVKGGLESTDPHYHCKDEIEKIAGAYKDITIKQKISLRDSSNHEDLIACRSGIERYAPSKGRGVLPAQQLAVNICYDRLRRQHPNIPSPPRLPAVSPPKGPPLNAGSFAGSAPKTNISSYSPPEVKAPADDGDPDFLDKNPDSSRFSPAGFSSPSASPGGSGGSPAGGSGSSGGGSSESPENSGEEGDYSGLSPTEGFGFAPGEGGEEGGKDPWAEGGADGKGGGQGQGQGQGQARTLEEELEELKKLPDEYLDLKEKDLIRAMTPPGKHENIFEYHTFFLNWYCRTYGGCGDYFRSMGFPSHLKPEKPRLLKVYDKELRERGERALSPRNPRNENRKADKDQR